MRKVVIIGDGTNVRTKLYDAPTGEKIEAVTEFKIGLNADRNNNQRINGWIEFANGKREDIEVVEMRIGKSVPISTYRIAPVKN